MASGCGEKDSCDELLLTYLQEAQSLIQKCRQFQHIKGMHKLEKNCRAELRYLQSLSKKAGGLVHESQLKSSNLCHFAGILHAMQVIPGVDSLMKAIHSPSRTNNLHVDIVAGQGQVWVKVIARKAQALHLIWAGEGQFGDHDLIRQAEDYVTCAKSNPVNFCPPTVNFAFYNQVTYPMAEALEERGVRVWGERVEVDPDVKVKLQAVNAVYLDSDDEGSEDYTDDESVEFSTDDDRELLTDQNAFLVSDKGIPVLNKQFPMSESESPVSDKQLPVSDKQLPVSDKQLPVSDKQLPVSDKQLPVSESESPVSDKQLPVSDKQLPVSDKQLPVSDKQLPVSDKQLPVSDKQLPVSDKQLPVSDKQLPVSDKQLPVSDKQLPVSDKQLPVSDKQLPVSDKQLPVSDKQLPVSDKQLPVSDKKLPVSDKQLPVSDNELPVSDKQLPVSDKQLPVSDKQLPLSDKQLPVSDKQLPVSDKQLPVSVKQLPVPDNELPRSDGLLHVSRDNKSALCKTENCSSAMEKIFHQAAANTESCEDLSPHLHIATHNCDYTENVGNLQKVSDKTHTDLMCTGPMCDVVHSNNSSKHSNQLSKTHLCDRVVGLKQSSSPTNDQSHSQISSVGSNEKNEDLFVSCLLISIPRYDTSKMMITAEKSNSDQSSHIRKVNLDITTLITMVSAVTHGGCHFVFSEEILTLQAKDERENPALPQLQKFLNGKELYVCETAWEDFETILNTLGGPEEKKRAQLLLNRVKVIPDQPSKRAQNLPDTGKIRQRTKVIFGTGDALGAVTTTANMGFVRAAQHQGVSFAVYSHSSRALTEDKEKNATPLVDGSV
ncbi:uncharacterized protein LOC117343602 [Pecten maximus]|uniref:uncharacterized protein LOC117343602 n=1 Tax=Pecten maximus TaxID=6579 RepID=UPI00145882B9|nr:uncharacterized protein LOC117343602 [Pecten maximus]